MNKPTPWDSVWWLSGAMVTVIAGAITLGVGWSHLGPEPKEPPSSVLRDAARKRATTAQWQPAAWLYLHYGYQGWKGPLAANPSEMDIPWDMLRQWAADDRLESASAWIKPGQEPEIGIPPPTTSHPAPQGESGISLKHWTHLMNFLNQGLPEMLYAGNKGKLAIRRDRVLLDESTPEVAKSIKESALHVKQRRWNPRGGLTVEGVHGEDGWTVIVPGVMEIRDQAVAVHLRVKVIADPWAPRRYRVTGLEIVRPPKTPSPSVGDTPAKIHSPGT